MNCSDIPELMALHLTGELESADTDAFEAHLKECAVCAAEARWQRAFNTQLRDAVLAETVDSSDVERRAVWNIHSEELRKRRRLRMSLAAAAALIVAIGAGFGYGRWANRPLHIAPSGVFAAAAEDHRDEVIERQPRKWRVDAVSIHALAQREGVAAIDLNSVAPRGYVLQQAKFCRLDGKFYLHLVYSDEHGDYSLYLRHEAPAGAVGRRISTTEADGGHVAGFRTGSTIALVVTNRGEEAAVQFARAASAKIG